MDYLNEIYKIYSTEKKSISKRYEYITTKFKTKENDNEHLLKTEYVDMKDIISVIVHDPLRDEVALVLQPRIGKFIRSGLSSTIETVIGVVESDAFQPIDVCRDEIIEEIGLEALSIINLSSNFIDPARSKAQVHYYYSECRFENNKFNEYRLSNNEDEHLFVKAFKTKDVINMLHSGIINDNVTALTIMYATKYLVNQ